MKKLLALLLGASMLLSLASCGKAPNSAENSAPPSPASTAQTSGATPTDSPKIGLSLYNMTNPHFVLMTQAIQDACDAAGCELIITDPDKDNAKQVSDIEDLVVQGCDVIILAPVDTNGINVALQYCKDNDVKVINVDMPVTDEAIEKDLVTSIIATDNYEAGYVLGQAMVEQTQGQAKIGLLERVESQAIRDRVAGFEDAIANEPGMEIVVRQSCKTTTEDALPVVENFLQSNPEITDMFFGNDLQLQAGVNACEAASRTDIRLYSIDGSENGMDLVVAGKCIGTSAQFPITIGETAVEYAIKVANGEEVEAKTLIPSIFVDSSNVSEYIKAYE